MKYLKKLIRCSLALTIIVASGLPATSALAYNNTFAIQTGHPIDEEGYPYFPRMNMTVFDGIRQVTNICSPAYLDTKYEHSLEISDHHQSIVKTNEFFGVHDYWITHSEMADRRDKGQVMSFAGLRKDFWQMPEWNRGLVFSSSDPLDLYHHYYVEEQHPSQAAWLPGVLPNGFQSHEIYKAPGHLFVAMQGRQEISVFTQIVMMVKPAHYWTWGPGGAAASCQQF